MRLVIFFFFLKLATDGQKCTLCKEKFPLVLRISLHVPKYGMMFFNVGHWVFEL